MAEAWQQHQPLATFGFLPGPDSRTRAVGGELRRGGCGSPTATTSTFHTAAVTTVPAAGAATKNATCEIIVSLVGRPRP